MKFRFAAFIMTYERPEIIGSTIDKILSQTLPPELILIVDNSSSLHTEEVIRQKNISSLLYHRTGYNAGPAGAARIALERLAAEGYDWIYWGDDDDPPNSRTAFEELLSLVSGRHEIGAIGTVGGTFNRLTARTQTLKNHQLHGLTEVDYVPGGKNFIINAAVVHKGVLPSPELFYGFEELDFCLKIKAAGFKICIDGDALLRSRKAKGKTAENYGWKGPTYGTTQPGIRAYYSARNMLFILRKNRMVSGLFFIFLKTLFKTFAGFSHGVSHGKKAFKYNSLALFHFLTNRHGKVDLS